MNYRHEQRWVDSAFKDLPGPKKGNFQTAATADALLKTFPRLKNQGSVRVTIVTGIDVVLPFPVNSAANQDSYHDGTSFQVVP